MAAVHVNIAKAVVAAVGIPETAPRRLQCLTTSGAQLILSFVSDSAQSQQLAFRSDIAEIQRTL